ncbi:chromosome segregation protein SMC [Serinibacter arcticus]|uniref:Chromosome partition protein Smc n=1 Tax=Serinibacter arcticus TaxID=1655435 RepID=A0A2U1ZT56_9MICO|nr:chromosome segregation protein SMC [Serinibacter arcticus]PWD50102.1 chromosome segregation protein SMC [Serinibacter arcticus]
MYLKTLTLRGFKSFASATTLRLEPGITCVVGPNGSGKSNVVDALAWVMGEQGAKQLRGGSMADVIFAGTTSRPPLGRAEVALTIDNSDGALPIDYTEVTISRTMFSSGGSEYAINGTPCRLLDIQDLLSDSGLGRQMHVIVGQGQLDAVLRATPEERRGFIEEAAGILKHRKRKEKALRKLESTAANLARLTDLVTEIRRQLGPLAKQADVARRAAVVQADLRDSRARLLADDLAQARDAHQREVADVAVLTAARDEVEGLLNAARTRQADLERAAAASAPALAEATEVWYRLSGIRERLRGTATLADERCRLLGDAGAAAPQGPDPDDLDAQAERAREAEREIDVEVDAATAAMTAAVAARSAAETDAAAAERELAAVHRGVADRREGVARLAGQVGAVRSRMEAQGSELERLRGVLADATERASTAELEFAELELQAAGVEEGEEDLDSAHEAATAAVAEGEAALREAEEESRTARAELERWTARRDALELSLERRDGTGELLASGRAEVTGPLADALAVEPGWEGAVAAALGPLVEGAVVTSLEAAVDALRWTREAGHGHVRLVVSGDDEGPAAVVPATPAPAGGTWALDVVTLDGVGAALGPLLDGVVLVEDLRQARDVLAAASGIDDVDRAVTRAGDVLTATAASGGGEATTNVIALTAAREEAAAGVETARARGERARFTLAAVTETLAAARAAHDATLADLHASDARFTAVAERLGRLGAAIKAARAEAGRAADAIGAAETSRAAREEELAELATRLETAQADPEEAAADLEAAGERRDACAEAARAARAAETDARLAVRTVEERKRAIAGRAAALERAARTERAARVRAAELEQQRARRAEVARDVRRVATEGLHLLEHSLQRASDERDVAQEVRAQQDAGLAVVRSDIEQHATRFAELSDAFHRDEVARAEQRLRIEALEARAVADLGLESDVLLAEFGPDVPVPVLGVEVADGEDQPVVAYDRTEQTKRLRTAERALALLGRVNPLALEEHAALEERHSFLVEQVADVRKSRADLMEIVREIDVRVEQVFREAWEDTRREFDGVFARLFPGGEGRLLLTDPDDMLTTGVEVEARPPGKKVKRLSLLSGGERSLTAVALLVAIFRARPSPFYVMDEVEAALDDVNLGRLLVIFRELRASSQLIVITHQKRTMEIADALYGVTMQGDGVSAVISQRIEREEDDELAGEPVATA